MGDFAVDTFQETLKELITSSKLSLIIEEKRQLQSLEDEIKFLRRFLKATEKKPNNHPELMKLVIQIIHLVSKAENIVELFAVHAFKADHTPFFPSWFLLSLDLETVIKGMKTLTVEVKKIYNENMYDINGVAVQLLKHSSTESGVGVSGSSKWSNTSKMVNEKVVVGFEEDVERLIEKLDGGQGRLLEIISIIGTGGGGKTTLAKKVYDHPFTSHTFNIRVWINVSQDYHKRKKRDLLIRILESVSPGNHENRSDDELGEDVLKCLKNRKYLIVMDDIWGIEAWNDIERSFPKECMGSKVLFTSRVLLQMDSIRYVPHYLTPLPKNSCWELLQKEVFGMELCPPELVEIGEQIAKKCKGLPLAVVTIAGILATQDKTLDVWEKVAKHLSSIIAKNQNTCMEILELSYNHLPLHLRACFIHIGGYPEDNEIPIRELIWLWIAKGFIQQSEGGKCLETIAKDYLNGLINRSLVQVARKSPLEEIKACRIHDLLRELCLKKAEDDNFLVKFYKDVPFSPSATNNHIRVLSLEDGKWARKIGIQHLVSLRYLAYGYPYESGRGSCTFPFSILLSLETLNLDAPVYNERDGPDTIPLPCHLFMMVKLRHLYTKLGVFTFHHPSEETGGNDFDRSSTLDSLQTLYKICACEACQRVLVRSPNLRKLGLQVYCSWLYDTVLCFPNLACFKCLEKLTISVNLPLPTELTLQPGLKLPQTITRITLKGTYLKWEELSLLQTLPSLEVLRLIRSACCGGVWNTSELEGFPQLKYLRFYELDIHEWITSEDQFPKLEVLVIEECRGLKRIPIAFGNLNELREIKLRKCGKDAEKSAREIQKEQRNRKGDDDCVNLHFKFNG